MFDHGARTTGIGASRPFRRIPAIVSFLNRQPAFNLGGGNRWPCLQLPFAAAAWVGSVGEGFRMPAHRDNCRAL